MCITYSDILKKQNEIADRNLDGKIKSKFENKDKQNGDLEMDTDRTFKISNTPTHSTASIEVQS
jgi:hypothetical protein